MKRTIAILAASLGFACPALALHYRCVDLGALFAGQARALGLNNGGMVVGSTGNDSAPVYWTQTTGMRRLGPFTSLPNQAGYGLSVNDSGTVVGNCTRYVTDFQPFLWRAGSGILWLDKLGNGYGFATGVNSQDVSCGYVGILVSAVVWDAQGKATKLPKWSGFPWYAWGINDSGVVVGAGTSGGPLYPGRALKWSADKGVEYLGLLPGFDQSTALAVNNLGYVVGYCDNVNVGSQGFIVPPGGTMQPLGPLHTEIHAINDSLQAVGIYYTDVAAHAMVIDPVMGMVDLNQVADGIPQGWLLQTATGINNRGDISGYAEFGNRIRAFLLLRTD